jgi:hypothetical protein
MCIYFWHQIRFRKPLLYPAELRDHSMKSKTYKKQISDD